MPKICFTTIMVDDMAKALGFYADKLGFEVIKRDHYPDFVLLKHNYPIALHQVTQSAVVDYPNQTGVVLGIAVDDLAETIQRLSQQGVDFIHTSPQKFLAGWYAALRDPAGNVHELIQLQ
jgi:catechol 2,3-dioxygenase-like lactoylglutathione lyase family enzyme